MNAPLTSHDAGTGHAPGVAGSTTPAPTGPSPATLPRTGMLRLPVLGSWVRRRGLLVGALLALLTVVLAVWLLGLGDYPLSPAQVVHALLHDDGFASTIVRQWRAPRVLAALAFGAALGVAGAIFQSLTRNPLGSPDIIGFSTGAYTGVLLVGTVLPAGARAALGQATGGFGANAVGAFLGGMATAAVVYLLAWRDGVQGTRLVVVGIGVTAMLQALNLYLLLRVQAEVAMAASIWGAGTLSLVAWGTLLPALVVLLVLVAPTAWLAPSLRQLELGDDAASAHGVRVEPARLGLMLLGVALVAAVTAVAGPVAFVALAAPQIAHRLVGGAGIPLAGSAATGALLLLGADAAAQHLLGHDVPVGIVTVVGGGLYLILLLAASARRR